MADLISTMTISDWEGLIRKTFIEAWSARSSVDSSDFLYRIEGHFYLEEIAGQMMARPALEQIFKQRMVDMLEIFCDALLEFSDDAKQITGRYIMQAKDEMIARSNCPEIKM